MEKETEASKQKAVEGREQVSCRDGLTTRGRFVVGHRTAHKAPLCVRSSPLSAFDGPVFTSSSGSNVLEIDFYGLRAGGVILFLDRFSFFPLHPSSGIFFSFHASFVHTQGDIHLFFKGKPLHTANPG